MALNNRNKKPAAKKAAAKRKPAVKRKPDAKMQTFEVPLDAKPRLLVWDDEANGYTSLELETTERNNIVRHLMTTRGAVTHLDGDVISRELNKEAMQKEVASPNLKENSTKGSKEALPRLEQDILHWARLNHSIMEQIMRLRNIMSRFVGSEPVDEKVTFMNLDPDNRMRSININLDGLAYIEISLKELTKSFDELV